MLLADRFLERMRSQFEYTTYKFGSFISARLSSSSKQQSSFITRFHDENVLFFKTRLFLLCSAWCRGVRVRLRWVPPPRLDFETIREDSWEVSSQRPKVCPNLRGPRRLERLFREVRASFVRNNRTFRSKRHLDRDQWPHHHHHRCRRMKCRRRWSQNRPEIILIFNILSIFCEQI